MSGSTLSRRVLLRAVGGGGLVTAALLSGCDLDPRSSHPSAAPSPDPDQAILQAARAELSTLIVRLSATTGQESLIAAHRAQLAALAGDPPSLTRRARPLGKAQVVVHERRAAARFTRWAVQCGNGDLARVLASVAAGIRMQPVLQPSQATQKAS